MNTTPKHTVSAELMEEILQAIQSIGGYGSVELYVQNSIVTQITIRNIKKTSVALRKNMLDNHSQKSTVVPLNTIHVSA